MYDDIYKLLTEKLGILSHKEKARKRLDFHELEKNIKDSRQDWSSIRRKNIKDIMYEKYVIDMKHKHSLSIKQCKYLLSIILISIMFKTITSKDITYKDDKIQNIAGLEFVKGKGILKRPLCSQDSENITDSPELDDFEMKTMLENWERYLKTLRDK